MKQRQLVSMAPLTTSSSGRTTKKRRAVPTMCIDSKTHTTKKSEKEDLRHDLNMQILKERRKVPSSGTRNAKKMHHVQATLSVVEILALNCFPLSMSLGQ